MHCPPVPRFVLAGPMSGNYWCVYTTLGLERLLQRVELLFSTLDASLVFHPPEPAAADAAGADGAGAAAADEPSPTTDIDLSGVTCPMTFVKAKLKLETLNVGDTLAIVLDDGGPAKDVPASFRNEGQDVVAMTPLDNGQWRVVVERKR